ncbi:MAG TPA: hypothetical protein VD840_09345, partial [Sinorhizobium sp.]|nr:hypothetical protein [Sinorhizobium sp.]
MGCSTNVVLDSFVCSRFLIAKLRDIFRNLLCKRHQEEARGLHPTPRSMESMMPAGRLKPTQDHFAAQAE